MIWFTHVLRTVKILEQLLHWFGYLLAHILFFGANSPQTVVRRLRIAYRVVGVQIIETPVIDGAERTIFRCPYRNLGADQFGQKWLCHEKLDRVDDGYVTYLRRHKDIAYLRPTSCTNLPYCDESDHCYSEVSTQ